MANDAGITPPCPVCGHASALAWRRSADQIRADLDFYIHPLADASLVGRDYAMHRCANCSLCFADPLIPGDAHFYNWLTTCPWYYPPTRWEFGAAADLLLHRKTRTVLEVGCGHGAFLQEMKAHPQIRVIGLDLSPEAVARCRTLGLAAHVCDVNDYAATLQAQLGPIDAVVSFHVLEHLGDPVNFIRGMWKVVAPAGAVYVSTPYSPIHYERRCAEPLNRPPHHMTRWNARSYAALAKAVNLRHRMILPRALSVLQRTRNAVAKWGRPVHQPRGRRAIVTHAAAHPFATAAEFLHQLRREKVNGSTAADAILVEFTAL